MLHIVICDDDMEFADELKSQVNRYSIENNIDIRISIYSDGLDLIESYRLDIDLVFLDIQMKHLSGLETAEHIRRIDSDVSIIFLTSLSQYALEGYKYSATNYIVKPIRYVRLKSELDKWHEKYRSQARAYIIVSSDTGKYKVFLDRLRYIETYNRKLMLHYGDENIITKKKMKDMEGALSEASSFVRCHAGYMVNLSFVKKVEKLEIILISGEALPISQPKRKLFMERLAEYWGDML